MPQLVLPDVQEIKPTIQPDPLQLLLNVLYTVTAVTVILSIGVWMGWRFVPADPLAEAGWSDLINVGLAIVPPLIFFLRVSTITTVLEVSTAALLRHFVITMLTASAVSLPLVYIFLRPDQWLPGESTTIRILGYASTVGVVQTASLYVLLRVFVWENALYRHQVLAHGAAIAIANACAFSTAQAMLFQPSPDAFANRLVFQYGINLLSASVVSYLLHQMRRDVLLVFSPLALVFLTMVVFGLAISLRSGLSNAQITVASVNPRPLFGLALSVIVSVFGVGAAWFLIQQQNRMKLDTVTASDRPIIYDFIDTLSFRQRWSHYLLLILFAGMLALGVFLRNQVVNRVIAYQDVETGIRVLYPSNWLIDRRGTDYVFRVRNMRTPGFKTTIQVSVIPIGRDTTERNIADQLAVLRARQLIDYRLLSVTPSTFNGVSADIVTYTFISRDPSPFLESVPAVVFGEDIIFFNRGQAIVLTFRADAAVFAEERGHFQRFLDSLEL